MSRLVHDAIPEGATCAGCGEDARAHCSPSRGVSFGDPQLYCGRCYKQLYRAHRARRPLVVRIAPERTSVPACAGCGTTGGYGVPGRKFPERFDGEPYGVTGKLCKQCKNKLYRDQVVVQGKGKPTVATRRSKAKVKVVRDPIDAIATIPDTVTGERLSLAILHRTRRVFRTGGPPPQSTPCSDCSTVYGRPLPGRVDPQRYPGLQFGFDGTLCGTCYHRHDSRTRRGGISA